MQITQRIIFTSLLNTSCDGQLTLSPMATHLTCLKQSPSTSHNIRIFKTKQLYSLTGLNPYHVTVYASKSHMWLTAFLLFLYIFEMQITF